MRSLHRRGAENAEAPQREEGKREKEEKGSEEEERPPTSRTLPLSSAAPQRSLRLCGERVFYLENGRTRKLVVQGNRNGF